MKNIYKIAALLAAVLMILCVTGCGDTAGSTPTPATPAETTTPATTTTPAEPPFVARETPLTLEAIAAGTITLTNPWSTLKYKKNGGDFVNVTASANTIAVAAGDKVAFYANGSENTYNQSNYTVTGLKIGCSSDCYVYGNVMSLLSSSDFKNATSISTEYAFASLFYENTHIKNHAQKALVLPATTLAANCYNSMFCGCTGLTSAPVLPATALAANCYNSMFWGCTSLTSAPALPATALATSCYSFMFYGCTGLTSAPALQATTLAASCYYGMFYGCTGLTSAPALPAEELAIFCYFYMFYGCEGLTNAPALSATTLATACCQYMFQNCTSLTSTPVLHATELVQQCYQEMFKGCSSLSTVTCLATSTATDANFCTENWLDGVASTGIFKKASSMDDWPTNSASINNGIPSGWTVQNYTGQ